jgi:beta-glucosidase
LSYTKFEYHNLSVPAEARAGDEARISVEVQNVGRSAGDEVVELHVKASTSVPIPPWRASSEST